MKFKSTLFIFSFIIHGVISTPPADPIKCSSNNTNCTITNANGAFPDQTFCRASEAMYPTSEAELISIVASASKNNQKMKVATRFSHSITKLVCPDDNGILISTKNLNRVLKIDRESMTMTVESGVTLREIISEAARFEMALPYTPYWWGLTIGGLIGTGAHGSTLWGKGSAVHDYVTHIRIVSPSGPKDGFVKVRNLDESNRHLNAARVSLGVLGVISKIYHGIQVNKKFFYRIDDRVSLNTSGNGLYDFIGFRSTLSATLAIVRATEEIQEETHDANGKCISAELTSSTLAAFGYGLTNNGVFLGYPIVGFNNRMQSSGACLDSLDDLMITACPTDPRVKGVFYHQTAFSISLSVVQNFIKDVKKLVELEPKALCGLELYSGILMRYVTASNAYLGKIEDAIDFDITYYRSKDPLSPRLFEDIIEEIEQIGLFKYGGLPHWGKNRNIGFVGAMKKYNKVDKFLKVKKEYDSRGLFSSEWTDEILGVKEGVTMLKDGCALEGLCICSQDSHCAPKKNYLCKPGRVFKEARVCRHDDKTNEKNDRKVEL